MGQIGDSVTRLFTGLYSDHVAEETGRLADHYMEHQRERPNRIDVPSSLHEVTDRRVMYDPNVPGPEQVLRSAIFPLLGVYDSGTIKGPLNHILARMIIVPRMLRGYIDNHPEGTSELAIYTDPPLLQYPTQELETLYQAFFEQADAALSEDSSRLERFRQLGEIGEGVATVERAYPARGSTQAYETFGIFHLFPSNVMVDLTATSPGVILPTEADPLRFKDSVTLLKKNLVRPTYFEMLRAAIDLVAGRRRRYSANTMGTARNLQAYPDLLGAAKEILEGYLPLGEAFEIRLGSQEKRMKLATLIGDVGVVYSVRDKTEKGKVAHNVTIIDAEEASGHRGAFEEQWRAGEPIKNTDILDRLMKMKLD